MVSARGWGELVRQGQHQKGADQYEDDCGGGIGHDSRHRTVLKFPHDRFAARKHDQRQHCERELQAEGNLTEDEGLKGINRRAPQTATQICSSMT